MQVFFSRCLVAVVVIIIEYIFFVVFVPEATDRKSTNWFRADEVRNK